MTSAWRVVLPNETVLGRAASGERANSWVGTYGASARGWSLSNRVWGTSDIAPAFAGELAMDRGNERKKWAGRYDEVSDILVNWSVARVLFPPAVALSPTRQPFASVAVAAM